MSRDPEDALADALIDRAQAGGAAEVLAVVQSELAAGAGHPALHLAHAVALDCLGDHRAAADAAGDGVRAAVVRGRDGWRAALLALRALQLTCLGDQDPAGFDEAAAVRDLAEAQLALSGDIPNACERMAAHANLALAYVRLRLYELALPVYAGSYAADRDADEGPPEAAAVQQLNLAVLHLTWAFELIRIDRTDEAAEHCRQATGHAERAALVAAGEHRQLWSARGEALAHSALAHSAPSPEAQLLHVRAAWRSLALLGESAVFERAICAPMLALALARAGRRSEALQGVDAALDELRPDTDPVVAAATRHAQLVLLAHQDAGARAGLAYGRELSLALWRQRARRLGAAETLLRYERLRLEHEAMTRDSDVDVLTGAATRRAFERRVATLDSRPGQRRPVCVLAVDLDDLKQLNDRFGHQAGDLVLREVGRALSGSTRGEDLVARLGGDEFVAVLTTEAAEGGAVARRMLTAVRALSWPAELTVRPTVSIGVAVAAGDAALAAALADADRAMYAAKAAGGDAVVVTAENSALPAVTAES